jgi:regulator of replication initiation timing
MSARAQAKLNGEAHYFTGEPCKHGHVARRKTADGRCMECARLLQARLRAQNPQKYRDQLVVSYYRYQEKRRAYSREWYWRDVETRRVRMRKWASENQALRTANQNMRNAVQLRATPTWADRKAIANIYREAAARTKAAGVTYHVDHAVPLKSDFVCGLHCEANLQVLLGSENQKKYNRSWPDMWEQ